ncbi:MAG: GNAT family N-acetyltransferase [Bacillota bacterium]|jgi:GNAT superfamily N-acetyltransferase
MQWWFGEFLISTDKALIAVDRLGELFAQTYWAKERSRATIAKSLENSLCIGIFHRDKMVGFARVVTDYATMYWLCDVIIDEAYRGRGLGKKLIECLTGLEELQGTFGILATRDAHGLYEKYGFTKADRFMRRNAK